MYITRCDHYTKSIAICHRVVITVLVIVEKQNLFLSRALSSKCLRSLTPIYRTEKRLLESSPTAFIRGSGVPDGISTNPTLPPVMVKGSMDTPRSREFLPISHRHRQLKRKSQSRSINSSKTEAGFSFDSVEVTKLRLKKKKSTHLKGGSK